MSVFVFPTNHGAASPSRGCTDPRGMEAWSGIGEGGDTFSAITGTDLLPSSPPRKERIGKGEVSLNDVRRKELSRGFVPSGFSNFLIIPNND